VLRSFARLLTTAIVLTAVASAQQKPAQKPQPTPNFSGRWVIVSPEKGAGQEQIVTQDARTLTTEHPSEGGSHKMTYQLDGVEHRNAIPSHGAEIVMMSTAAWDGDRIVISTRTAYPNGMKTSLKEVWSLDAQGRLVIDSTESGPTGPGPAMKIILSKKK
jgi:hypothetical protein